MTERKKVKLNWIEQHLPEGLLVDASWLEGKGYSTSLRSQYLSAGWLEQPARRVYRRPRGSLSWQQAVTSLQTLMGWQLSVGGRTALELQGFTHYLSHTQRQVLLYGPTRPPSWLNALPLDTKFSYRNDRPLFAQQPREMPQLSLSGPDKAMDGWLFMRGLTTQRWGHWNWPLILSTPERAFLELLDELPNRETFHQADMLAQGLVSLSPRRLQHLLGQCRSVKVKRLFFYFTDRHAHPWAKHLDRSAIDLGKGKRSLIKGGKLDPKYLITVPETLNGVQ